jgi:hypothetical protein
MNISDPFFFTSSIEAPKLQRPPETFVPSTKTLLLKEQPKNGLRASNKVILTWVTLRARGGHAVHLVRYGGDYPLWTAWEEPDRHCWTLLSTTSPSGGSNPAKTPGSATWSDSSAWQRPTTHCKHDESGRSGTRLGHYSTSTLLSGLYPIGLPPLSLSPTICAEFPSTKTLNSKIGWKNSSRPDRPRPFHYTSLIGYNRCVGLLLGKLVIN